MKHLGTVLAMVTAATLAAGWGLEEALAQPLVATEGPAGSSDGPLNTAVVFVTLAVVPLALILVTSFAKIAVVFGFLRAGLGLQQVLPTSVVTALAVVLSATIMAPVGLSMARAADGLSIDTPREAWFRRASEVGAPLGAWLKRHAGKREVETLTALTRELHTTQDAEQWASPDHPLVLATAFALTELKEAFVIGVLIVIPFLVVEVVVANVLLSAGLQGLSPPTVSLPFKVLLFVLIDGWTLLVQGLVMGYTTPVG
ncbi:MAG: EscR/YscR/HrcR family type III secretion system export apparatus protein [Myxococcota bacterium]